MHDQKSCKTIHQIVFRTLHINPNVPLSLLMLFLGKTYLPFEWGVTLPTFFPLENVKLHMTLPRTEIHTIHNKKWPVFNLLRSYFKRSVGP